MEKCDIALVVRRTNVTRYGGYDSVYLQFVAITVQCNSKTSFSNFMSVAWKYERRIFVHVDLNYL